MGKAAKWDLIMPQFAAEPIDMCVKEQRDPRAACAGEILALAYVLSVSPDVALLCPHISI